MGLWLRCGALALTVLGLAAAGLFFSLPTLLLRMDKTEPADVILHFAIDGKLDGDAYVAELYWQGVARQIVCLSGQASWEVYPADYARAHLIELGVPAENVVALRLPNPECRARVMPIVAEFVKERGWRSALMIVDPTLSRSNHRVAAPVFQRAGLKLTVTCAPRDVQTLTANWWREHWKTQRWTGEALETFGDFFFAECW